MLSLNRCYGFNNNNNGIDIKEIKQDVENLKEAVEEFRMGLKWFINIQKRKKQNEKENNKHKTEYFDCLNELKARFKK